MVATLKPIGRPVDVNRIDTTKIKGLEPEFLRRQHCAASAQAIANADPLPGSLAKAFPLPEIKVGKFSVRAPRAYDWTLLKAISSPLYRQTLEVAKSESERKDIEYSDEDAWLICWQFTRPCREVDAIYCKGGKAAMIQFAKEIFAFEMHEVELNEILAAAIRQMVDTSLTALKYKAEKEGDGSTTFFQDTESLAKTA